MILFSCFRPGLPDRRVYAPGPGPGLGLLLLPENLHQQVQHHQPHRGKAHTDRRRSVRFMLQNVQDQREFEKAQKFGASDFKEQLCVIVTLNKH